MSEQEDHGPTRSVRLDTDNDGDVGTATATATSNNEDPATTKTTAGLDDADVLSSTSIFADIIKEATAMAEEVSFTCEPRPGISPEDLIFKFTPTGSAIGPTEVTITATPVQRRGQSPTTEFAVRIPVPLDSESEPKPTEMPATKSAAVFNGTTLTALPPGFKYNPETGHIDDVRSDIDWKSAYANLRMASTSLSCVVIAVFSCYFLYYYNPTFKVEAEVPLDDQEEFTADVVEDNMAQYFVFEHWGRWDWDDFLYVLIQTRLRGLKEEWLGFKDRTWERLQLKLQKKEAWKSWNRYHEVNAMKSIDWHLRFWSKTLQQCKYVLDLEKLPLKMRMKQHGATYQQVDIYHTVMRPEHDEKIKELRQWMAEIMEWYESLYAELKQLEKDQKLQQFKETLKPDSKFSVALQKLLARYPSPKEINTQMNTRLENYRLMAKFVFNEGVDNIKNKLFGTRQQESVVPHPQNNRSSRRHSAENFADRFYNEVLGSVKLEDIVEYLPPEQSVQANDNNQHNLVDPDPIERQRRRRAAVNRLMKKIRHKYADAASGAENNVAGQSHQERQDALDDFLNRVAKNVLGDDHGENTTSNNESDEDIEMLKDIRETYLSTRGGYLDDLEGFDTVALDDDDTEGGDSFQNLKDPGGSFIDRFKAEIRGIQDREIQHNHDDRVTPSPRHKKRNKLSKINKVSPTPHNREAIQGDPEHGDKWVVRAAGSVYVSHLDGELPKPRQLRKLIESENTKAVIDLPKFDTRLRHPDHTLVVFDDDDFEDDIAKRGRQAYPFSNLLNIVPEVPEFGTWTLSECFLSFVHRRGSLFYDTRIVAPRSYLGGLEHAEVIQHFPDCKTIWCPINPHITDSQKEGDIWLLSRATAKNIWIFVYLLHWACRSELNKDNLEWLSKMSNSKNIPFYKDWEKVVRAYTELLGWRCEIRNNDIKPADEKAILYLLKNALRAGAAVVDADDIVMARRGHWAKTSERQKSWYTVLSDYRGSLVMLPDFAQMIEEEAEPKRLEREARWLPIVQLLAKRARKRCRDVKPFHPKIIPKAGNKAELDTVLVYFLEFCQGFEQGFEHEIERDAERKTDGEAQARAEEEPVKEVWQIKAVAQQITNPPSPARTPAPDPAVNSKNCIRITEESIPDLAEFHTLISGREDVADEDDDEVLPNYTGVRISSKLYEKWLSLNFRNVGKKASFDEDLIDIHNTSRRHVARQEKIDKDKAAAKVSRAKKEAEEQRRLAEMLEELEAAETTVAAEDYASVLDDAKSYQSSLIETSGGFTKQQLRLSLMYDMEEIEGADYLDAFDENADSSISAAEHQISLTAPQSQESSEEPEFLPQTPSPPESISDNDFWVTNSSECSECAEAGLWIKDKNPPKLQLGSRFRLLDTAEADLSDEEEDSIDLELFWSLPQEWLPTVPSEEPELLSPSAFSMSRWAEDESEVEMLDSEVIPHELDSSIERDETSDRDLEDWDRQHGSDQESLTPSAHQHSGSASPEPNQGGHDISQDYNPWVEDDYRFYEADDHDWRSRTYGFDGADDERPRSPLLHYSSDDSTIQDDRQGSESSTAFNQLDDEFEEDDSQFLYRDDDLADFDALDDDEFDVYADDPEEVHEYVHQEREVLAGHLAIAPTEFDISDSNERDGDSFYGDENLSKVDALNEGNFDVYADDSEEAHDYLRPAKQAAGENEGPQELSQRAKSHSFHERFSFESARNDENLFLSNLSGGQAVNDCAQALWASETHAVDNYPDVPSSVEPPIEDEEERSVGHHPDVGEGLHLKRSATEGRSTIRNSRVTFNAPQERLSRAFTLRRPNSLSKDGAAKALPSIMRGRSKTFTVGQVHRKTGGIDELVGSSPHGKETSPIDSEFPSTSHFPLPGDTPEETYKRLYSGRLYERANAQPTAEMIDAHWQPTFLQSNHEEVRARLIAEGQEAAEKRRADAQNAHKAFHPYFQSQGFIPPYADQSYQETRRDASETELPQKSAEEFLPRPRGATVATKKPQVPYHSPFYPQMDDPFVEHKSVQEMGLGHRGPVGSGIFMPFGNRPGTVAGDMSSQTADSKGTASKDPLKTPRKQNPGIFSLPKPRSLRGRPENEPAEDNAPLGEIHKTETRKSSRGKMPFNFLHHKNESPQKSPALNSDVSSESSDASTITPRKMKLRSRAATAFSQMADKVGMGKRECAPTAIRVGKMPETPAKSEEEEKPQTPGGTTVEQTAMTPANTTEVKSTVRQRATTSAAKAAKDAAHLMGEGLSRRMTAVLRPRRHSEVLVDKNGRRLGRPLKDERAPKNWDPAFNSHPGEAPPTPGRPAKQLKKTSPRQINELIRAHPGAAQIRVSEGWHPTHDVKASKYSQVQAWQDQIDHRFDDLPREVQDVKPPTQAEVDEIEEDKRRDLAERNAQLLSRQGSTHKAVLARDPSDVFGEAVSKVRSADASIKSGRSARSFRSLVERVNPKNWRLSKGSMNKKLHKPSRKGTLYDDGLDNPGGNFRMGEVRRMASVRVESPVRSPTRVTVSGDKPDMSSPHVPLTPSHTRQSSAPGILKSTPRSDPSATRSKTQFEPNSPTPVPRKRGMTVKFENVVYEHQLSASSEDSLESQDPDETLTSSPKTPAMSSPFIMPAKALTESERKKYPFPSHNAAPSTADARGIPQLAAHNLPTRLETIGEAPDHNQRGHELKQNFVAEKDFNVMMEQRRRRRRHVQALEALKDESKPKPAKTFDWGITIVEVSNGSSSKVALEPMQTSSSSAQPTEQDEKARSRAVTFQPPSTPIFAPQLADKDGLEPQTATKRTRRDTPRVPMQPLEGHKSSRPVSFGANVRNMFAPALAANGPTTPKTVVKRTRADTPRVPLGLGGMGHNNLIVNWFGTRLFHDTQQPDNGGPGPQTAASRALGETQQEYQAPRVQTSNVPISPPVQVPPTRTSVTEQTGNGGVGPRTVAPRGRRDTPYVSQVPQNAGNGGPGPRTAANRAGYNVPNFPPQTPENGEPGRRTAAHRSGFNAPNLPPQTPDNSGPGPRTTAHRAGFNAPNFPPQTPDNGGPGPRTATHRAGFSVPNFAPQTPDRGGPGPRTAAHRARRETDYDLPPQVDGAGASSLVQKKCRICKGTDLSPTHPCRWGIPKDDYLRLKQEGSQDWECKILYGDLRQLSDEERELRWQMLDSVRQRSALDPAELERQNLAAQAQWEIIREFRELGALDDYERQLESEAMHELDEALRVQQQREREILDLGARGDWENRTAHGVEAALDPAKRAAQDARINSWVDSSRRTFNRNHVAEPEESRQPVQQPPRNFEFGAPRGGRNNGGPSIPQYDGGCMSRSEREERREEEHELQHQNFVRRRSTLDQEEATRFATNRAQERERQARFEAWANSGSNQASAERPSAGAAVGNANSGSNQASAERPSAGAAAGNAAASRDGANDSNPRPRQAPSTLRDAPRSDDDENFAFGGPFPNGNIPVTEDDLRLILEGVTFPDSPPRIPGPRSRSPSIDNDRPLIDLSPVHPRPDDDVSSDNEDAMAPAHDEGPVHPTADRARRSLAPSPGSDRSGGAPPPDDSLSLDEHPLPNDNERSGEMRPPTGMFESRSRPLSNNSARSEGPSPAPIASDGFGSRPPTGIFESRSRPPSNNNARSEGPSPAPIASDGFERRPPTSIFESRSRPPSNNNARSEGSSPAPIASDSFRRSPPPNGPDRPRRPATSNPNGGSARRLYHPYANDRPPRLPSSSSTSTATRSPPPPATSNASFMRPPPPPSRLPPISANPYIRPPAPAPTLRFTTPRPPTPVRNIRQPVYEQIWHPFQNRFLTHEESLNYARNRQAERLDQERMAGMQRGDVEAMNRIVVPNRAPLDDSSWRGNGASRNVPLRREAQERAERVARRVAYLRATYGLGNAADAAMRHSQAGEATGRESIESAMTRGTPSQGGPGLSRRENENSENGDSGESGEGR